MITIHTSQLKTVQRSRPILLRIGWKWRYIGLLSCLLTIGATYLVQVNSLATKGYHIRDLEKRITQLEAQAADLQSQTLALQSMEALKQRVALLPMVPVGALEYLKPNQVALATR